MSPRRVGIVLSMQLRRFVSLTCGIVLASCLTYGTTLAQPAPPANGPASGDAVFMSSAMAAGLAEINEAQMALQKSQNPAVRAFAQRMIADHSLADSQLQAMAQDKGLSLPQAPTQAEQQQASQLASFSGQQFDFNYAHDQVADHIKAVALFQQEVSSPGDLQIRNLAATTLPTLQKHLELARQLVNQVAGQ